MIRKVWPLVAAAVALGIDAYVLAGVLPSIAESLTTTVAVIGLGVTAFTAAYAVGGPLLSGRLTRGSTARALLIALGVFNLGNLITVVAPGVAFFLASRVVAGAGAGILTAVATATAAAMVADRERGRAMAMVTFGLSTGTVAGVPVGMLIGQSWGWRWTMALVVAVGVLSMIALAARAHTLPTLPVTGGAPVFGVLRSGTVSAGIVAAFLLGVASLGLYTYLLPMADTRGLRDWGFALVWAWGVGGVTGAALIGRPLDRYGPRALLVALPALLAASFAAFWAFSAPAVWLIAAAVWGAAAWASVPTLQQALTRDRPDRAMAVIAFQMAAMYLGSAAGAAAGSSLLAGGADSADLAGWALVPAGLAIALLGRIGASVRALPARTRTPVHAPAGDDTTRAAVEVGLDDAPPLCPGRPA
ncbi:MFS transporter [Streptomyces filamentosus]|uniref:MFS transporter n=1 Tax=Streptomyces filamentosus TaxID=67294 RepID=A0ABY4UWD2_STRFL|nr:MULTISPECIES: MFS transporter [Streptomyces]ESU48921.1 major facilitator superfamily protein [Streptomyces sp. HCCB10043]MYR80827.1 MFS transporter [Streptomyces sp. SID5466]USC47675.1 MFS transporter [Streptomyces filamentosus]